jgi:hypothetical protein
MSLSPIWLIYLVSRLYTNNDQKSGGGGVGFYIKNDIKFKLLPDLSPFIDKIFESTTIETIINNKKCTLCNYYWSLSPVQNMTSNDQLSEFVDVVDNLSSHLSNLNTPTYIISDSNLNLLNFPSTDHSESYLHSLHSNGFLWTNFKATRMYNDSFSLIDHIFSNNITPNIETGSVVDDISDHFVNFIQIPYTKYKKLTVNHTNRMHTPNSILMFRNALRGQNWLDVVSSQDVITSYNNFWQTFKSLYDIHFPITPSRPNKNIYKINNFMTRGLLISRINKNKLHNPIPPQLELIILKPTETFIMPSLGKVRNFTINNN